MSIIALVLAAAAPVSADLSHLTHDAAVDHGGNRHDIRYRPEVDLRMRTVGMSAGTRMSTERCMWTASVAVHRLVQADANTVAIDKRLPGDRLLSGSVPGACKAARPAVDAALAARHDMIRDHVVEVAQADHPRALADIAAAKALALN